MSKESEFILTDKQYEIVLNLYHELNAEFYRLSEKVRFAFYRRLYAA